MAAKYMICGAGVIRFDSGARRPSGSNEKSVKNGPSSPNGNNHLLQRHRDLDLLDEIFAGVRLRPSDEGN
jgi:hypothetical protein